MPIADTAAIARAWATDRAIDVWVLILDGITGRAQRALAATLAAIRTDGARAIVVRSSTVALEPELTARADDVATVDEPASPRAILTAAWDLGVQDVRRIGVLGADVPALDAGIRSGAGAVVGIAAGAAARRRLVAGQPDVIIQPAELAQADAQRWGRGRAIRERVLLNPGPAVVSDRVHRAIAGPDMCHREVEYEELSRGVRADLCRVAGAGVGWEAVLLAGSGTSAMEAMVGSAVRPGRRLLVIRNGTYGDRLATMADRAGIPHVDVVSGHVTPADPVMVSSVLDAHPDVDAIAVVHHETTTGMLNPVRELAGLARERGVLLAVDAISSFGAEELPLAGGGIDLVAGTANKCLHGLPGVAFVLLSPAAVARAAEARPASLYLDLAGYLAAASRGSVPFTPGVPATYALRAALDELLDEGVETRRATYLARMRLLDEGLERLGLEPVVAPGHRSASVRAIPLPPGVSYPVLHDRLKAAGYVIYAGQGVAAAEQFRVCALGTLGLDALGGLLTELATIMAEAAAGTPAPHLAA